MDQTAQCLIAQVDPTVLQAEAAGIELCRALKKFLPREYVVAIKNDDDADIHIECSFSPGTVVAEAVLKSVQAHPDIHGRRDEVTLPYVKFLKSAVGGNVLNFPDCRPMGGDRIDSFCAYLNDEFASAFAQQNHIDLKLRFFELTFYVKQL